MATLEAGQCTELESYKPISEYLESTLGVPKEFFRTFVSTFGLLITQAAFDFRGTTTLNQTFPDIQTTSAKELFESAWSRKQGIDGGAE